MRKIAILSGLAFLAVGVLGFFPNTIIGQDGFFRTDGFHDIFHITAGVIILLSAAAGGVAARWAMAFFGLIYMVLFLNGIFSPNELLGFINANANDSWLHLIFGSVLLAASYF